MNILLKQVLINDPHSPHNGQVLDLFIENNRIKQIGTNLSNENATVIHQKGLQVSTGWVDCFAHFGDPGFEFNESFSSGAAAAAAGGFTRVFTLPNTKPVTDNKSLVEYAAGQSKHLPVHIHPLGAITQKTEGKELAEMYDMRNSGAIAFSDGLLPVQSAGLFVKALQYVKAFDGVLIQLPIDRSIGSAGLINEGVVSTQLGLPGLPSIAEISILKRDLDLLKYSGSKIHFTGITTKESLDLIAAAKAAGLKVTCSVTPYHLFFCDEDLQDYNTYLKVNPPLRTRADMMALREGVANGTVDCIASHHFPQDWDHKICEFEYASFGMNALESSFSVVNHLLGQISNERLIELFSLNARNIFGLPTTHIVENEVAELTIYHRNQVTQLAKENIKSNSFNNAFTNIELNGKVYATINNGQLTIN